MENASDALIMAFGVLVFVLALSISISLLGQARETSNIVFSLKDRENDYIYVDLNSAQSKRTVGVETVISSIYRAYKENYKIIFFKSDGSPYWLYESHLNLAERKINTIDLTDETNRNGKNLKEPWINTQEIVPYEFLEYLLSGNADDNNKYFKYISETKGLYNKLKNSTITEYLGEFYEDDLKGQTVTSNANKLKKRIITYVIN